MTEIAVQTKRCTKCGEVKALSYFQDRKHGLCGKASACKTCDNARRKQDYYLHHQRELEHHKQQRLKYPLKWKLIARRTYLKHRDERLAQVRHYYYANREQKCIKQRQYDQNHREQQRAFSRRYRKTHKDNILFRRRYLHLAPVRGNLHKKYQIEYSDITPQMVALEREHIELMRIVRSKKKEVA